MTPLELRALVPAVRDQTYLDTATYGPAAEPTVAALSRFAEQWSTGSTRFETWDGYADDCRALFAALVGARPEEIAIQPFVSTAMGTLAVQLLAGDRVVVNDIEYGSNIWPWIHQRERGVEVAVVATRDGRCTVDDFRAAAGGRVTAIAVSAFQSSNGWRAPLAELAEVAHSAGGMLFVDACQGAGAIRLDPSLHGFDVLASDSYKWLMGPRGAGYMYLSPPARERFRPVLVGPHAGASRLGSYYGREMRLSETASAYDSSLSWMSVAGDREALRLIGEVGVDVIEKHDLALAERFREGARRLGIAFADFPEAERSPVVAVLLGDPESAVGRLREAGVVAAPRATGVRFAFHVFNDESDVDRALDALR